VFRVRAPRLQTSLPSKWHLGCLGLLLNDYRMLTFALGEGPTSNYCFNFEL